MTKEEKEVLWDEIAEKLNALDPKGFRRTGHQAKRKYIKYQSEQRIKNKQKEVAECSQSSTISMTTVDVDPTSSLNSDTIGVQQDSLGISQAQQMSFVDIIGVIPDVGSMSTEQVHMDDQNGETVVTRLEPITNVSRRREEYQREKIALQKIGLFMKMKKYQRAGHLNATDVRLITRWIKSPSTMPFKSKH